MDIYIGVGSNIEPEKNIKSALEIMLQKSFKIEMISTHYRTKALRHKENPPYINGIWKLSVSPSEYRNLKQTLKEVELACGRIRSADKWASRTVDLDIILAGDYASEDILERDFIYIPLLELDEKLYLPGYGRLKELLNPEMITKMNPLAVFTEELRRMIDE